MPQSRVRGRKPHDPQFDVRTARYLGTGVDLTAVAGSDAVPALTRVGERGGDFSKWPTIGHFTNWRGYAERGEDRGEVPAGQTRRGKNRAAGALPLVAWTRIRIRSDLGADLRR